MKGALFDGDLRPLAVLHEPTPAAAGPQAVVDTAAQALLRLTGQAADHGLRVHGAGVVVPGIVREDAQLAVRSVNLGWRDLPLAEVLSERTGLPVVLGHDVRAGGLAESVLGAARGVRNVLFVAIGTGIAGALVCDGEPTQGQGYAGELGHLVVDPGGARCACGGRGCLETVASASAVAAAFTARTGRSVEGAAGVAALVARGDADAVSVWQRAVDALATALATTVTLFGCERVVLGGGLAEAGELLLGPVRQRLDEKLTFQRRPSVVAAELGDRAGCLGAGLLARRAAARAPGTFATAEGVRR
ncbi:ROK family transcriptional regulator [Wenjunlia vitaminophila]|uniref:ROK family transcriptional regulator n=2 Tax=Wenjunlia vitaminophila TaxID=76728 RepID=A0A0T6LPQ8_WENVI|nr:ROK family transcriptional regulator [Wenjunlia vitaminophila]